MKKLPHAARLLSLAMLLGGSFFIASHVLAASSVYSSSSKAGQHVSNAILPTANGLIAHARYYVPTATTSPYVFALWTIPLGAGSNLPSGTIAYSDLCTLGADADGNYYDCNFATSSQYSITNYATVPFIYSQIAGAFSSATTSIAASLVSYDDNVNNGLNGSGYNWKGYFDDTPSTGSGATQINTVIPAGGSTTATTTAGTVGSSGYVSSFDLSSSTKVRISLYRNQDLQASVASPSVISQTFDFPVSVSGAYDFSTTTGNFLREGAYTMRTSITNASFSFLGFTFGTNTLVSTTTSFILATTTAFDRFQAQSEANINSVIDTFSTGTCQVSLSGFNLGDCILALFIPNGATIASQYAALPAQAQTKFPFSYMASMAETWSGLVASTTLNAPTYEYKLGDLGIGSTTALGNILPNVVVLSSSTVEYYFPVGLFDTLKALAGIAIILALFFDIFFTVRNMIRV